MQTKIDGNLPWRERETLSIEEAAIVLNVGRGAAYAAAHSGDLPGVWFGRRFLVSVPRLKRMIDDEPIQQPRRKREAA